MGGWMLVGVVEPGGEEEGEMEGEGTNEGNR